MLFRFLSCACVAVGLGFGGYTTSNQLADSPAPPTRWVLRTLDGKPLPDFQNSAAPQLVLSGADATQGERHQGTFQHSISARLQTIPHVISTIMRSDNQAMDAEMRFLSVLEQTTHFEISGNILHLYATKQAAPLATFKAESN